MTSDYRVRLTLDAPPDVVQRALTEVDELPRWWTSWDSITGDGSEGGRLHFAQGRPDQLVMNVVAARPTVVAWDVIACPIVPDWTGTRPTFTFTGGAGGGTELTFHHVGLSADLDCYSMCQDGWQRHLTALRLRVAGAVAPAHRR